MHVENYGVYVTWIFGLLTRANEDASCLVDSEDDGGHEIGIGIVGKSVDAHISLYMLYPRYHNWETASFIE